MQCTLLIPHLVWSRETAAAMFSGLALPALTTLLARARAQRFPALTAEGWLCQAFEIERQQDWPVAPFTLALDGGEPGDAYWLRADPVHIKVERHRLLLVENALFDLSADEAQALAASLDRHFGPEGIAFHAPHPKRWYARLARAPNLVTHSVSEVAGQDVRLHLPTGDDALHWHGVFNEAQMLLHGHPVNAEREERGEPIVNSVWFWGGGTRTAARGGTFGAVWSDEATATSIAAAADTHAAGLPAGADAWLNAAARRQADEAHLIVLDELASARAYRDGEAWRSRVAALEAHWFAPLRAALRERRISSLALVVPLADSCWRFDVAPGDLYKLWRRPKPWSEYG